MNPSKAIKRERLTREILRESAWDIGTSLHWREHTARKEAARICGEFFAAGPGAKLRIGKNGTVEVETPADRVAADDFHRKTELARRTFEHEEKARVTLVESMRMTVRRPPRTRVEHASEWLNYSGAAKLSLLAWVAVGITIGVTLHGWPLWVVGAIHVTLIVAAGLVIKLGEARRLVEVGGQTGQSLRSCLNVWEKLPKDLREDTRDVLDAAFWAAVLPRGAQDQVERRLVLLREFADEVERQAQARQVESLGEDDLEIGRARLDGMRETRRITKRIEDTA
jgi:hypothetical protein